MPKETSARAAPRYRLWVVILVFSLCGAGLFYLRGGGWSVEMRLADARVALQNDEFERAERTVRDILAENRDWAPALLVAGRIASRQQKWNEALQFYGRVPQDGSESALKATDAVADICFQLGRVGDAERAYRRLLTVRPHDKVAHRRLADILLAEGRRAEAVEQLFFLLREDRVNEIDLILLGNVDELYEDDELAETALSAVPNDPRPRLGAVRLAICQSRSADVMPVLRKIVTRYPDLIEAQALMGRALMDVGDRPGFVKWNAQLPQGADAHPDVWASRGRFAEELGELGAATRAFWEAVRRDANHLLANYRLGQLLVGEGRAESATPFLERAERLTNFNETLQEISRNRASRELPFRAGKLADSLGRPWEACAWYAIAARERSADDAAARERNRILASITAETPLTLTSANPALDVDFSFYPLPSWEGMESSRPPTASISEEISFADVSADAGLNFQYSNGWTPDNGNMMIFQNFGGGVAASDYDLDGWVDLYLTQAHAGIPRQPPTDGPTDRLFRNLGSGRFRDESLPSGVADAGFTQGVASGDFDSDGFPDFYLANIGRNRLYRNNGDGTFSDFTAEAGLNADLWTNSCAIADVNGDGLPDLYDVNYLHGDEPIYKSCFGEGGVPHSCRPSIFTAERDRLFLNQGNGQFSDVSAEAGIDVPGGKGLGIVVFDADGSGPADLFIANDMTPNFFLVGRTPSGAAIPAFAEEARLRGLAFDADGLLQACMGVAVGDANGDGRIDLFVTNFYNESNTLYCQESGNLFVDATRESGLREPGFQLMGFGTQFLDANLDGWLDLVVANGHIDDFSDQGIPFRMPPQFFLNQGAGRFREVSSTKLGRYFQQNWLGRGLARLDWNRDGKPDFAVTDLGAPAALLENVTSNVGHFLALTLYGVRCNRDAVGTKITVTAGKHSTIHQIVAGDGYQASNQRQLIVGLGRAASAEVRIDWPTGDRQMFRNLPADSMWKVVQGSSQPYAATASATPPRD